MYRKKPEKWPRPVDFVILDFVSMHLSFLLACRIGQGPGIPYADPFYRNAAIMLSLLYLTFVLLGQNHKDRYRRGWGREFIDSARMTTYLVGLLLVYLFLTQSSTEYSRAVFLLLWGIQILLTYLLRMLRKWQIRRRQSRDTDVHSLILLTTSRRAEEMTRHLRERSNADLRLTGVGIVDGTQGRISIDGIPVIAGGDQIPEWIRRNWVDEVFLDTPADTQEAALFRDIADSCLEMGITVHHHLAGNPVGAHCQSIGNLAGYTVLSVNDVDLEIIRQPAFKRVLDICGGLAGCVIAAAAVVFVGPWIYLRSPGPIFFTQNRVGKNGKQFEIYKFRSMYLDAEERKQELMEQNQMQGLMFKLENDPRIIRGVGNFIRRTSIDELPQFWNVLKGDMSLVGTRPPTVDEWEAYQPRHRKRLAVKPGMTGMWQVSGRSDITDFEEVVNLDIKYIRNWSFYLDVKILLKTVLIVLKRNGAA